MTNKEIVKAWIKALDANDFNTIKNLMANNYQFRNPITPNPIGADEHLGMMHAMKSAFEAHHEMDMIIEEDNYVVISGKWKGKHVGEFNGAAATGKSIEFYLIDSYYILNGKVEKLHVQFNPAPLMTLTA